MSAALRALLLVALATGLWHLPRAAAHPFNWDSVNHALAAHDYDLPTHQPHPPGYPLWIGALRALGALGVEPNLAQILLAQLALVVAVLAVVDLARGRGRAAAWVAGALLVTSPLVALHARLAGTYTAELAGAATVGWACAGLWRGGTRRAPAAVAAWVLAAGLRTSAAVFLGPLLVVALGRAYARRPLRALGWLVLAGLGAAACYVPVWLDLGPLPAGFLRWRATLERLFGGGALLTTSWFHGAPLDAHLGMLVRLGTWWVYALLPALPALALLRAGRGADAAAEARAHAAADRAKAVIDAPSLDDSASAAGPAGLPSLGFLALWAGPSVAFLAGLYAPHPGYALAPLPAFVLLLVRATPRGRVPAARLALAVGALLVTAELLGRPAFGPAPPPGEPPRTPGAALAVATPAQIARSDAQLDALAAALAERPPEEPLVVLEVDWNQANWRKLAWVLPERRVWWLTGARGGLAWMQHRRRGEAQALTVPRAARALWWVAQADAPPAVLARAFPDAERVLQHGGVSLWRAPLGDDAPAELAHGPRRWPLQRE